MDFPNQKIERHLDQDHSVLPRGRQAVSFLTFMSSSLVKEKPLPDWYWLLAYTSASHFPRRHWKFWRNQVGGLLDVQGSTGRQNELLLLFQFADHYSLPPTWCKTAAPSKWGRYFEDCILESGLCVLYLVFGHVSLHGQSRAGQKGPKRLTRNRNRGGH